MSEIKNTEGISEVNHHINLKLIKKYQQTEPSLMAKYKYGMYDTGSFRGVSNTDLNIITCEDNIVIPLIIQSYVLHCYHTYILHTGMDITEATIIQNLYWPGIVDAVQKKVTNCGTFRRKK